MVTKYGMSDKVGPVAHDYDENGLIISSETRQVIEDETRVLVDAAYGRWVGTPSKKTPHGASVG